MKPILVFQSDFTYREAAVSSMYGVVKTVDPGLEIITGTHEIPRYDIWSASYRLFQPMIFWPKGTVFVSVVDPGVGTGRKACVAGTKNGYLIVTPDNGTLAHVDFHYGIEWIRAIDIDQNRLQFPGGQDISVFHGRDVFAYNAARIASGQIGSHEVGPEYSVNDIVRFHWPIPQPLPDGASGIIEIEDPNFGNLWSSIPVSMLNDKRIFFDSWVHVTIEADAMIRYDQTVWFSDTFGRVENGKPVLYQNEYGNAALALNQGSFIGTHDIHYGPMVSITIKKEGKHD